MRFPFVLRSQHEEMVGLLRQQLEDREKELRRIKDLIFKEHFGVQIHDTLPENAPVVQASAPPAAPEEETRDREKEADARKLATIRRLRPSQLGPELERRMNKRVLDMARAAHPQRTQPANPSAVLERFEKAKEEALAN